MRTGSSRWKYLRLSGDFFLCAEAGVTMTGAGAAFPYGVDPEDSNIRIAPSYPTVAELQKAMDIFCTCIKLAAVEKLLRN